MKTLKPKFVEFIPDNIENGILYITMEYRTAVHKCVCGCNNEVVTPITPTDWRIAFDGKTVSLYPSISNSSFPCKSHYWISKNMVEHAMECSESEIVDRKKRDARRKKKYFKMIAKERL